MVDLSNKTILVTGGTGFIGKCLCKTFAEKGARIFILTRSSRHVSTDKITYISSLSDLGDVSPHIIINLAGEPIAKRWTVTAKDKIWKSRIDTTAAIIEYIKSSVKKPTLLISGSAVGYYGIDKETEFNEYTSPATLHAAFSRSLCVAWENEASKAEQYGVRTVLLRVGAVLEKDGGILQRLLTPFYIGLGGPMGHGHQWLSWIDRSDLIELILYIIGTPTIAGPINATTPNPVSNLAFAKALAGVLGKPCIFRTPALVLRFAFGHMADEIMLNGQKVIPQKAIDSGYNFLYPTLTASLQKIFCI